MSHVLAPWAISLLLSSAVPDHPPGTVDPSRDLCAAICGSGYGTPDLNSDGRVDFCDAMIFATDFITESDNPRSDFNDDGEVNLTDDYLFVNCTCPICPTGPLPLPVATTGTATIGVYFDPLGTVSTLTGQGPGIIDFYVVAHGISLPGLSGYTYQLDAGSVWLFVSEQDWPPDSYFISAGASAPHTASRGGEALCLSGDAVVLGHYELAFVGGQDVELRLDGADICIAPSESPSYVACGDSCNWTYFASNPTVAVINPTDFNNNGIGDRFEVDTTQFYRFTGVPVDWSMGVRGPDGAGFHHQIPNNSVPVGAGVAELAEAFVDWFNSLASTVHATIWDPGFGPGGFSVTVPGAQGFELGVGPPTGPNCWMPPVTQCDFGPIIEQLAAPTGTDPAISRPAARLTNYPNPFNPSTMIAFDLAARAQSTLRVFDSAGRAVRTLLDGELLEAGHREVHWDGRDDAGNPMPAGVYHFRLTAGVASQSRPMVLLK